MHKIAAAIIATLFTFGAYAQRPADIRAHDAPIVKRHKHPRVHHRHHAHHVQHVR